MKKPKENSTLFKIVFICLFVIISNQNKLCSQITITGKLVDFESGELIIGSIKCSNCSKTLYSIDGDFQVEISESVNEIIIKNRKHRLSIPIRQDLIANSRLDFGEIRWKIEGRRSKSKYIATNTDNRNIPKSSKKAPYKKKSPSNTNIAASKLGKSTGSNKLYKNKQKSVNIIDEFEKLAATNNKLEFNGRFKFKSNSETEIYQFIQELKRIYSDYSFESITMSSITEYHTASIVNVHNKMKSGDAKSRIRNILSTFRFTYLIIANDEYIGDIIVPISEEYLWSNREESKPILDYRSMEDFLLNDVQRNSDPNYCDITFYVDHRQRAKYKKILKTIQDELGIETTNVARGISYLSEEYPVKLYAQVYVGTLGEGYKKPYKRKTKKADDPKTIGEIIEKLASLNTTSSGEDSFNSNYKIIEKGKWIKGGGIFDSDVLCDDCLKRTIWYECGNGQEREVWYAKTSKGYQSGTLVGTEENGMFFNHIYDSEEECIKAILEWDCRN